MTNDELLSKTISYLRFPLTIGVVFIHFNLHNGLSVHGVIHGLENPDWYFFTIKLISECFARISVPLFYLISGFLFFYRIDFNKTIYGKKLRSRAKSLLIPYILWNVIAILWQMKCFLPGLSSFYRPVEVKISFVRILYTFFCNTNNNGIFIGSASSGLETDCFPINIPLWYVRDLMVMVIVSPAIYAAIKKTGFMFVTMAGFLWFASPLILPIGSYVYISMLINALFFFSWGAYFSIKKIDFVHSFRKYKYIPFVYLAVAITDALCKGTDYSGYIHLTGILLGIISAIVVASYLLESKKIKVNETLANSSFFIYAFHYILIGDVGKFAFTILHIPDNNPYVMLFYYFAVPAFTIIVCLSLYVLLKRFTPNFCNLLTGGR